MKALTDFFTTDYGLLSAFVIFFVIGMAIFLWNFYKRKMAEPPPPAGH
jgi:hypothetical protein